MVALAISYSQILSLTHLPSLLTPKRRGSKVIGWDDSGVGPLWSSLSIPTLLSFTSADTEASGGREHSFSTPPSLLVDDWTHLILSEHPLSLTRKEWAYWPEFSCSAGTIKSQAWWLSFLGDGSQDPCIEPPFLQSPNQFFFLLIEGPQRSLFRSVSWLCLGRRAGRDHSIPSY